MMARPSAYMMAPVQSTRIVPKRSAIPPANGWPIPQSRFCRAKAPENTSRPQPLAIDSGVRNWPAAERGPKVSKPIRQPHRTIRPGVRQASGLIALVGASSLMESGAAALMLILPGRGNIGPSSHSPNLLPSEPHPVGAWQPVALEGLERAGAKCYIGFARNEDN